ncbi:MAG: diacylglycerol kinase family lipid kinase [Candidatus Aenigmarchaeota archaeon]|nr:diacylglycerol kinase family lipid kinase [Candidatus Aenigmarchaeota archaeon]
MRAKIILNSEVVHNPEKVSDRIERYLKNLDVDFEFAFTEYRGHARDIARESDDCKLVVAVGGDGTVNEVVNGIMGFDKILYVIPLGNENNFGKSIGIPKNLEKACERLYNSEPKLVDVGKFNDRYFISSGGIGLDGEIIKNLDRVPRKFPRPFRYFYTAVSSDKKPKEMEIEFNGRKLEGEKLMVMTLNTFYVGNGMKFVPDAKIDDGMLDLLVIGDIPLAEFGINLLKVYQGKRIVHPKIEYEKIKEVYIHTKVPTYAQVDGESFENPLQEVHISICPKALRIMY